MGQTTKTKKGPTKIKKMYYARFIFRILVLLAAIATYIWLPESIDIMLGFNMFKTVNVMHIFLAIWIVEITMQFLPLIGKFSIGSLKHFQQCMQKATIKDELKHLRNMVQKQIKANIGAFKVLVLWITLFVIVGVLSALQILTHKELFVLAAFLYFCDLVCVLFFCPFQTYIMKNKCCVNCRIYDWGHFMMFTPMLFIKNFFSWSLFFTSLFVLIHWEIVYAKHPQRFWSGSNQTLQCQHCKDKTCQMKKALSGGGKQK